MADIYENEMGGGVPSRIRALDGARNSISPTIEEVLNKFGIYRVNRKFVAGEEMEINFKYGGTAAIRVSSYSNTVGMAVINSDLSVKVLNEFPNGNFGSKIEGKVCIYRKENNGHLYLYNGTEIAHNINVCLISVI